MPASDSHFWGCWVTLLTDPCCGPHARDQPLLVGHTCDRTVLLGTAHVTGICCWILVYCPLLAYLYCITADF
jgi:hypothetical protein